MALPVFNNQGSTGNGTPITANGTFLTIQVPGNIPPSRQTTGTNQTATFDAFSYLLVASSTGVGTVVTFQEIGSDGVARNLVSPAPITLANSTTYNPSASLPGPWHALQIVVSNITGGGLTYGELRATVRQGG